MYVTDVGEHCNSRSVGLDLSNCPVATARSVILRASAGKGSAMAKVRRATRNMRKVTAFLLGDERSLLHEDYCWSKLLEGFDCVRLRSTLVDSWLACVSVGRMWRRLKVCEKLEGSSS